MNRGSWLELLLAIAILLAVLASCSRGGPEAAPSSAGPTSSEFTTIRRLTSDDYVRLVRHRSGRCFVASSIYTSSGFHWVYSQVDREMCDER